MPVDLDAFVLHSGLPLQLVNTGEVSQRETNGVTMRCDTIEYAHENEMQPGDAVSTARFEFYTPEIIRVRLAIGNEIPVRQTGALEEQSFRVEFIETGREIQLKSTALKLNIHRSPWRICITNECDHILLEMPTAPDIHRRQMAIGSHGRMLPAVFPLGFAQDGAGEAAMFFGASTTHDEHFYGFGEAFSPLDKRGQAVNPWRYGGKAVPFFLSSAGYGLLINNHSPVQYHMGDLSPSHYGICVKDMLLDFFFIHGPSYKEILARLAGLLGKPTLPPLWSFRLWAASQEEHANEDFIVRLAPDMTYRSKGWTSDWGDLGSLWRAGLGLGLSGQPFWGIEIPTGSTDLFVRWAQAAIFISHPQAIRTDHRDPQAREIFNKYALLRHRLLPYLWSTAHRCVETNQPLMRPLLLDWQHDPTTATIDDQWLFGEWIMVAPILDGTNRRDVYLPDGRWIDVWTGESIDGPVWRSVDLTPDLVPLYVRGGAILPLGSENDEISHKTWDPLTLDIYPFGESMFVLYEGSERVEFACFQETNRVTVSLGASEREYSLRVNSIPRPRRIYLDDAALVELGGEDVLETSMMGWVWDGDVAIIKLQGAPITQEIRLELA